jgi:hypothetical protein
MYRWLDDHQFVRMFIVCSVIVAGPNISQRHHDVRGTGR